MKAITTKYHGATDTRGARISASDLDGNRATVAYRHDLNGEEVHRQAVIALCTRLSWSGRLAHGSIAHGNYVYVWLDVKHDDIRNSFTV